MGEYKTALTAIKNMKSRGITVLPGGDYGFAWTPHGTYARDLQHFVELFGYTPTETLLLATSIPAERLFMRDHELGKIQEGYLADVILVDGNPLEDIKVLQDVDRISVVVINGRVHKCGPLEHYVRRQLGVGVVEDVDLKKEPWKEVKRGMQVEI